MNNRTLPLDNQIYNDMDSPTWFTSITDEDKARFQMMALKPPELDNIKEDDENQRSTEPIDPIYLAVLNDFNSAPSSAPNRSEDPSTTTSLESEADRMDISDASPEEISEDTIIPCVVGDEKGAFITKMGHGGVEFVESLYSPESGDKGAFITKMNSQGVEVVEPGEAETDPGFVSRPLELHRARAVATATCVTIDSFLPGTAQLETSRVVSNKSRAAASNSTTEHSTRKSLESGQSEGHHSLSASTTTASPLERQSSNPWEFPSNLNNPNLSESKPRPPSSQSSGIASMSSSLTSSTSSGSDMSPKDVMISYSHSDRDIMKIIKARLEDAGISVWVDSTGLRSGVDFLSKIGQAIIDAKLFVSLVSEKSLKSKFCRDELSLAYISDKFLFPVALDSLSNLVGVMDTGLKLVLTRLEWTLLYEPELLERRMTDLVVRMQKRIEQKSTERSLDSLSIQVPRPVVLKSGADRRTSYQSQFKRRKSKRVVGLNRQHSCLNSGPQSDSYDSFGDAQDAQETSISLTPSMEQSATALFFWQRSFQTRESVTWSQFKNEIMSQYGAELDRAYTKDEKDWLLDILRKELTDDEDAEGSGDTDDDTDASCEENRSGKKIVKRSKFEDYCRVDGKMLPFWVRLQDQAMEKHAMRAVFGIEAEKSYRLKAVENLARFKSVAVMQALVGLLEDEDPNVRAIAAISVSKCGGGKTEDGQTLFGFVDDILLKLLLEDRDRLVRESVCIAFGHRQTSKAVPHLVDVWRNDNISSVRNAAQLALQSIGGEEADRAIQMTNILTGEMYALTMSLN